VAQQELNGSKVALLRHRSALQVPSPAPIKLKG
jgi:hypothetical protein